MAQAKTAIVASASPVGSDTRLIELEPEASLDFVGGQYLIVNSGVVLENGKMAKRAYSILSSDARQDRVQIAVKRIGEGPGSTYMHRVELGSRVEFSGPWGKFLPDDSRPRATWVLATDTGITAALGLVGGQKFRPQRAQAALVWMRESDRYFLPEAMVRELAHLEVQFEDLPRVGSFDRIGAAKAALVRRLAHGRPESVFLVGDGAVLYPMREQLAATGVPLECIRIESFFNNPEKKSQ